MLQKELDLPLDLIRSKRLKNLPTVLSHEEAMSVISKMGGVPELVAQLLYSCGVCVSECLGLRVRNLDFSNHQIIVRDGKCEKDRATLLPDAFILELKSQFEIARLVHQQNLKKDFSEVYLPYALERKYPNASRELAW